MKQIPWNKGLTKETDKRIYSGPSWNKGLTKETDKRIKSWNVGLTKETNETVKKISESLIGVSTGKASTKEKEEERKRKISETMKRKKLGGYRKGSGRGKKGRYKGIWCDSSWELAWVIFHLDHNIKFERNLDKFEYIWENEKHQYLPDFKINDEYIEIKGYMTKQAKAKLDQFPKKIKMISEKEMTPILEYVKEKYGDNFISLYEK